MSAQTILPSREMFTQQFKRGLSQLVWTTRPADLDTPVSAMLRLMDDANPCFLLESVEKGEIRGRYSVIGLMPDLIFRSRGNKAEIAYSDSMDEDSFKPCAEDTLTAFRKLFEASKIEIPEGLPPMSAGLVGYMSYDMVRLMENLPVEKPDPINIPDSCFIRPKLLVIFDNVTDTMYIITTIWAD